MIDLIRVKNSGSLSALDSQVGRPPTTEQILEYIEDTIVFAPFLLAFSPFMMTAALPSVTSATKSRDGRRHTHPHFECGTHL